MSIKRKKSDKGLTFFMAGMEGWPRATASRAHHLLGFESFSAKTRPVTSLPPQKPKQKRPRGSSLFWLGLGDGNITFSDELDFDVAELDIVYEDNDEEASQ